MKKILLFTVIILALPVLALAGKSQDKKGSKSQSGSMNVEVRNVSVHTTPNYMGSSSGSLNYGTEVKVIGEQGNWFQIEKPAGWVPKGALTKHKVVVNPDQKVAGKNIGHDEVALAGKGFNPQVEAQYKKNNSNLAAAYAAVDKVEMLGAPDVELKQFQATGKLKAK